MYKYLRTIYQQAIETQVSYQMQFYEDKFKESKEVKEEHLRKLRPNLSNPANKEETKQLNEKEQTRTEDYKELIDDKQIELLDCEQNTGLQFYTAFLNNTRALVFLFDKVIYKEQFIMLPGDEITEKKHKNIKHLIAAERNEDLSRKETRAWPGLGAPVFKIDITKMQPSLYGAEPTPDQNKTPVPEPAVVANELNTELVIKNTPHHKQIVKARNQHYSQYKARFEASVLKIFERFDVDRAEEVKFNAYWQNSLEEIVVKHI